MMEFRPSLLGLLICLEICTLFRGQCKTTLAHLLIVGLLVVEEFGLSIQRCL